MAEYLFPLSLEVQESLSEDALNAILPNLRLNSRFVAVGSDFVENVERKIEVRMVTRTLGQLSMTLIGFLETEDYVLEFSNN